MGKWWQRHLKGGVDGWGRGKEGGESGSGKGGWRVDGRCLRSTERGNSVESDELKLP